jgi:hypothetical protein
VNIDPRQDIIVVHKEGIETYVFQPRFCGEARAFGLVMPVPAKLTIQPSLTAVAAFSKLDEISQPQIQHTTLCRGPSGAFDGGAGARADASIAPTVISSGTVGFMDYAQLDTPSVEALTAWLDQNGYPYDAQATATFDYYVNKGWYFLTFKIDQGVDGSGVFCRDLGPIKLSFPSAVPVVPTRMATARARDTNGSFSYATGFSWRIFGITAGDTQIEFASHANLHTLNFSGLLSDADASSLSGLAAPGDRATKLVATFRFGSTEPDIDLDLAPGQDYREIIYQTTYITCADGGVDPKDASGGGCAFVTSPNSLLPTLLVGLLLALRRRRR